MKLRPPPQHFFCLLTLSISITSFTQPALATGGLNDTGIDTCSNETKNKLLCSVANYPGQDAEVGRDKTHTNDNDGHAGFSFTKISSTGAALSNDAKTWNCVRDNVTGLVWEIKTSDKGLHDKSWVYSWYEPDAHKNGSYRGFKNGGSCKSAEICDTYAYVAAVNKIGWCGFKNWRMPNKEELRSLVSYDRVDPAIDSAYFPNTKGDFWSSTTGATANKGAWLINFSDSNDKWWFKGGRHQVRLVRGTQ